VTEWHINATEPRALDYNDYNQPGLYNPDAYRSSDHDPAITGLRLGKRTRVYLPLVGRDYTSP
jgi:predicted extracellular nuclease